MAARARAPIVALALAVALLAAPLLTGGEYDPRVGCYLPQDVIDYADREVFLVSCCPWSERAPDRDEPVPVEEWPTGLMAVFDHSTTWFNWGICQNCLLELQEVCDENGCQMQRICSRSEPLEIGFVEYEDGTAEPLPEPGLPALAAALLLLAALSRRRR